MSHNGSLEELLSRLKKTLDATLKAKTAKPVPEATPAITASAVLDRLLKPCISRFVDERTSDVGRDQVMEDPHKAATIMWSPPRPDVIARRLRNAAWMQAARSRETPEASESRRKQNASRMEVLRAHESQEQAAERRARNAAAMQAARARETPEQTAARRAQNAARMEAARAKETPQQKAARRSLNAARMQAARAKEALCDTASSVGINVLMEDEVMRKAVLAAHSQPPKKRKTFLDSSEHKKLQQLQAESLTHSLSPSSVQLQQSREEAKKFSFHVN